jgi:hypothetical protein
MRKWIVYGYVLCLIAIQNQSISQTVVSGVVTDTINKPLRDINVMIYPKHGSILKAFSITDQNGNYAVEVNLESDSLDLLLSSIHFERIKRTIPNQTQRIDFALKPDTKLLETITVKARPIDQRGDTLSYLVEHFKGREDQTIEDVLKKLPGIEVEESGKILYQGLPINKFYVEGLDLTDGRYAMISSNLPHEAVSTVEVFEKHQPVRILEDMVYSPQAALNLKLKKKVAYTGSGKISAGISPWLWDIKTTPMLLTSGLQLLASYQTNNSGDDVSKQIQLLTPGNLAVFPLRPSDNIQLFNISDIKKHGSIDPKRHLDNQIHLANVNILLPLKKDIQLRANVFFIDDFRKNQRFTEYTYYLPLDTIHLKEGSYSTQFHRNWQGSFDLYRNTRRNYLHNKTQFNVQQQKHYERISLSVDTLNQFTSVPFNSFSNVLNSIFKSGTTLIEFQSLLQYDNGPQELTVSPGQFDAIVNSGTSYDLSFQTAILERFFADHYFGSTFQWKRLNFSVRTGFSTRWQSLKTNLKTDDGQSLSDAGTEFQNDIEARQYQLYLIPALQYKHKTIRFSIDWPLSLHHYNIKELNNNKTQDAIKLLQAPKFSMNYSFADFWELSSSWYYLERISDPDDFHYSYVLKNYRELIKTDAVVQQSKQHMASASISYRNTITAFFNTFSYFFTRRQLDLIYETQLQQDGSLIVTALKWPNSATTHNLRFRSSKYIHALRSSLSLNTSFMMHQGKTLANDELFDASTTQYTLSPEIYYQTTTWLSFNYKIQLNVMQSNINDDLRNKILINKHYLSIHVFPKDNHMLHVNLEYFRYRQCNYDFVDLMYRYKIPKSRFTIEARWNNILNSDVFLENYSYQFTVVSHSQALRPSQFFLGLRFSF